MPIKIKRYYIQSKSETFEKAKPGEIPIEYVEPTSGLEQIRRQWNDPRFRWPELHEIACSKEVSQSAKTWRINRFSKDLTHEEIKEEFKKWLQKKTP